MSVSEEIQHYKEILKELEDCHKNIISIINSNNPFSDDLRKNSKDIYEIILLYTQFDKLRNSVKNSDKVQKDFEKYLEHTQNVIDQIRKSADSLAETGLKFSVVEESKDVQFGEVIKKQFIKFKSWIQNKLKQLEDLKQMIKDDMAYIEREIQKEFSKIK